MNHIKLTFNRSKTVKYWQCHIVNPVKISTFSVMMTSDKNIIHTAYIYIISSPMKAHSLTKTWRLNSSQNLRAYAQPSGHINSHKFTNDKVLCVASSLLLFCSITSRLAAMEERNFWLRLAGVLYILHIFSTNSKNYVNAFGVPRLSSSKCVISLALKPHWGGGKFAKQY